jgi:uncharacterized oxidoreductase
MKTNGNTVLITGGGTGIGLALAECLLRRENTVIICGRRRQRLLAAKKRHPGLIVRVCDVTKPASRRALVRWVTSKFGNFNILVNNAGIQRAIDFRKGTHDVSSADEEVAVNLLAPIHLGALCIPHLRRRKSAAIINISSGLAFTPLAFIPVYCATKAAVHSFSLSLRHQLRNTTIRVFEIAPPMVATELSGRRQRPNGDEESMSPDEAGRRILDAMEHNEYEAALGQAAGLRKQREALFTALNG